MKDMTKGDITLQMVLFSIPLMLDNMLQQLYGIANAAIVGHYLGRTSLAAVGTANPIMNIMTFLLVGMTIGASILLAGFFGAGQRKKLLDELATSTAFGLAFTILLSAVGILCVRPALRLINAPAEIIPQSASYLVIILSGLPFVFLNNMFSSAMRAVGESVVPFCILAISSAVNAGLALLLVGYMGIGVAGAAYSTFAAQAVAALLSAGWMWWKIPCLRLGVKNFHIDISLLRKTISYSSVSGLQQSVIFIGVFAMQGAINPLGVDTIAAYNAIALIDGFVLTPGDSLATALMMFISQNVGARRFVRVKAGLRRGMAINYAATVLCCVVLFFFPYALMHIFLKAEEASAVAMGAAYLKIMSVAYLMSSFSNVFQGFFRGVGKMDVVLYATFVQIPVRVALTYFLVKYIGIYSAAAATFTGWSCMAIYQAFEYKKFSVNGWDHCGEMA